MNLCFSTPSSRVRALSVSFLLVAVPGACGPFEGDLGNFTDSDANTTAATEANTAADTDADPTEGPAPDTSTGPDPTTDPTTDGTQGAATEGATEGATTEGVDTLDTEGGTDTTGPEDTAGTTGDPDAEDYAVMEECRLPVVCEPYSHLISDGGGAYHPMGEELLPGEICLFTGMRDGAAGRYSYMTDYEFGNGHEDVTYVIHVHADRKVTFVAFNKTTYELDEGFEDYLPAKTCTLADPAFFDTCATDINKDFSTHDDCTWTDLWWTDCVESGPKCE